MPAAANARHRLVFVRPLGIPSPRNEKNMRVGREMGLNPLFLGAFRDASLPRSDEYEGLPVRRTGPLYLPGSLRRTLGLRYVQFARAVTAELLRLGPDIVHASNLRGLVAAMAYRVLRPRSRLVYDIHDNLALELRAPRWVKRPVQRLDNLLGRVADAVFVPDRRRADALLPWVPRRLVIVPNTPDDPGWDPVPPMPPLRLAFCGRLQWTRGARMMGDLVASRDDVELEVAGGRGSQDVMDYFESLPRTRVHGPLTQPEALELCKQCHLVVALYDPVLEINRQASPNKLYDAMATARPVLINSETAVADDIVGRDYGFAVPYGDAAALDALVDSLLHDPEAAARRGRNGRRIYETGHSWEAVAPRVRRAYAELLRETER